MTKEKNSYWFKHAWPWFVFGVPFLTVIAGIITYKIAANNPHSMVEDDYFKEGLALNQSLEKIENAKVLKIEANISIDKSNQLLVLDFIQDKKITDDIKLVFLHPTKKNLDQTLILNGLTANQFVTTIPNLPQANWHIRISDKGGTWLLKTRWNYPQEKKLAVKYQS